MPEVVEVYSQAQKLKKYVGQMIIGINWDKVSKFDRKQIPGLDLFALPLIIQDVYSRGKIIIIKCDKNIYLVNHLGMTGFWSSRKTKHSNFWIKFGKEVKEGLYSETKRTYFTDQRHFGNISICSKLKDVYKKNGPCVLQTVFQKCKKNNTEFLKQDIITRDYCHECLSKYKKEVCEFLLEQKYVSGIGNYLRAEILYHARIHPLKKNLNEKERNKLYDKMIEVVYLVYKSFQRDDNVQKYDFSVYMQKNDLEGNSIEQFKHKTRMVHFCPAKQKLL